MNHYELKTRQQPNSHCVQRCKFNLQTSDVSVLHLPEETICFQLSECHDGKKKKEKALKEIRGVEMIGHVTSPKHTHIYHMSESRNT